MLWLVDRSKHLRCAMLLLAGTGKRGFALARWADIVLARNVFSLLKKTCRSEKIFFSFHKWDSSVCVVQHLKK